MKPPDWEGFISAIVAAPEDDTLRLVAADFLEENGEPDRAAFIRVQVALASLEADDLSESLEADELRKKERALLGPLSEFPHLWAAEECPELVRVTPTRSGSLHVEGTNRLVWRRGFVEEVRCPAAEWLRHGAAVRRRNPVRVLYLSACESPTRDAWYAGLPALEGLEYIDLRTTHSVDVTNGLGRWLKGWLPGTEVSWIPF